MEEATLRLLQERLHLQRGPDLHPRPQPARRWPRVVALRVILQGREDISLLGCRGLEIRNRKSSGAQGGRASRSGDFFCVGVESIVLSAVK
jgi:hypothetical protein